MRFLHTADWQIGRAFPGLEETKAVRLRDARFETVSNLLHLAGREKVDAILAVGNLWADNRIRPQDVERLAGILASSPVPVYLVPGASDPYTFDSPYRLQAALFKPPMVVLTTFEPVALGDVLLCPCPILARGSSADPTAGLVHSEGVRVGLAWRSRRTADDLGLAYLALGESVGPPEPIGFDSGGGNVLLVDLPGPTVKPHLVRTFRWEEATRELHQHADVSALRQRLEEKANPDHGLLLLHVSGTLAESVDGLEAEFAARYFHLHIDNRVAVTGSSYRHPLLREMVGSLAEKTAGPEAEAARQALAMLGRLVARSPELE